MGMLYPGKNPIWGTPELRSLMHSNWPLTKMSGGLQFYGIVGMMLDGNQYLQPKICTLCVVS